MDSMTRHFDLKKAVSGFLLVFNFHPCKEICGLIVLVLVLTVFVYETVLFPPWQGGYVFSSVGLSVYL